MLLAPQCLDSGAECIRSAAVIGSLDVMVVGSCRVGRLRNWLRGQQSDQDIHAHEMEDG
jgi:hypothetical protein